MNACKLVVIGIGGVGKLVPIFYNNHREELHHPPVHLRTVCGRLVSLFSIKRSHTFSAVPLLRTPTGNTSPWTTRSGCWTSLIRYKKWVYLSPCQAGQEEFSAV